jgi:hypothetical protein
MVLLVLVLLAGSIAPFVNAAGFSGRIQHALESSLGRKITFGEVHFTLFAGPGFTLTDVTIQESPGYGLEPFAYVPKLQVRVRLDHLILGHIAVSSLRLVDPSLNIVKTEDGTWNVVELVSRMSAPSRLSVDLFPAFEISGGRLDFKFGARKTVLYISDSDLSVYPQRLGKLYVRFSGSPARTDRAGTGFGHLHGTANWYLKAAANANRLEADVTLDPSNLSDLTTLFEGEDAGVHGMVSSHARIEGPAAALRLAGDLHLSDIHRWDLLPSSGQDLHIHYQGQADLVAHKFDVQTVPSQPGATPPVALRVRINDFLSHPSWTILATLSQAPVQELLPISKRLGLALPDSLNLAGTVNGVVGYSNNRQLSGGVSVNNVVVTLPNTPPLRAANVSASISANRIHIEPATVETTGSGALQVGGDYDTSTQDVRISLHSIAFPISALKNTFEAWFTVPASLSTLQQGKVTGEITYGHSGSEPPLWSGQFQFMDASLRVPGLAEPLTEAQGHVQFDSSKFDLNRFSATAGKIAIEGTYRFNALAKRPEHLRLTVPSASLEDLESMLDPTLRAQGLLARLGVVRRTIPSWLAERNLQGEVAIEEFSIHGNDIGSVHSSLSWRGPDIQFSSLAVKMPNGEIQAAGDLNIATYLPRYRFTAAATGFSWRGGTLSATGEFQTSGTGVGALQHLHANGTFSGQDLNLSADDLFSSVSGKFLFSFADGWPDLRVSNLQVTQGDDAWTGGAASQSDGKLVIDLERPGQQRHVVSTLEPEAPALSSQAAF